MPNDLPNDPVVEEVRRARDEYAQKFDYDLDAIVQDVQRRQATRETKVVRRNPRLVQIPAPTPPDPPHSGCQ